MKIILRMLVILGVVGAVGGAAVQLFLLPLIFRNMLPNIATPAAAELWLQSLSNVLFWPILIGGIIFAERQWRKRFPAMPVRYLSGLLRWLGLVAAGLLTSVWVSNVYVALVLASTPPELFTAPVRFSPEFAALVRQLEAQSGIGTAVWLLATVAFAVLTGKQAARPAPRMLALVQGSVVDVTSDGS